jgi:hypothetical protein
MLLLSATAAMTFVSATFGSGNPIVSRDRWDTIQSAPPAVGGPVPLAASNYTQNFDGIASGLPTGWSVSSNATATSVGNQNATYNSAATSWGDATGAFKNVAAVDSLTSGASAATQAAATDRALGLRQTATFGDPGAAFNFEFSSIGAQISSIAFDLQMLSVQTRSTTFSIQYGIGPSPSTFTTLGTWADPGAFGSTTFTFTTTDFGTNLDNQSDVLFRVVALSPSTGTGSRDTVAIDNFSLVTGQGMIQPIAAVPEPATIGMMVLGAGLLAGAQRFRRKLR